MALMPAPSLATGADAKRRATRALTLDFAGSIVALAGCVAALFELVGTDHPVRLALIAGSLLLAGLAIQVGARAMHPTHRDMEDPLEYLTRVGAQFGVLLTVIGTTATWMTALVAPMWLPLAAITALLGVLSIWAAERLDGPAKAR